jgi:hypothetical protein
MHKIAAPGGQLADVMNQNQQHYSFVELATLPVLLWLHKVYQVQ